MMLEAVMTAMPYAVKISTSRSINFSERWLENFCVGEWRMCIDGISPDLSMKTFLVYFQREADKVRFKDFYRTSYRH